MMLKNVRILLIDDDPGSGKLLNDDLRDEPETFVIIQPDNRAQFDKHIAERGFDLVLSETKVYGLPELRILKILKEKIPAIPVIIFTVKDSAKMAVKSMKMGACDYIIKEGNHSAGLGPNIRRALRQGKNSQIRKPDEALKKDCGRLEKALEICQAKYNILFENIQDVFYQTDNNGLIVEISPSIEKISQYSRAELIGKPAEIFYWDPKVREKLVTKVLAEGMLRDFDLEMKSKDGQLVYATNTAYLLYDKEGHISGISGFLKDITRFKEAEKAVRENDKKFRDLGEKSPNMIFINQRGRVVYANKKCEEITGYRLEDICSAGFDFLVLIAPEYRDAIRESFNTHLEGLETTTIEYEILTKSGKRVPAMLSTKLIEYEGAMAVLGIVTDLSERVESEIALLINERRFKQVSESSGVWVWEVDADGLYTYVSSSMENILGYKPKDVIGKKHFYDLFRPDVKEALTTAAFGIFSRKEKFVNFENANIHKDGHTVTVETSGLPMLDEHGNLLGYRGADKDISDRKIAEEEIKKLNETLEMSVAERTRQLEAANKELESFSYSVSHDLRTPLRALNGYASILREEHAGSLTAEARRLLGIISDSAVKMNTLIEDLLGFSRLGRQEAETSRVNMFNMAKSVYEELLSGQEQRDINFILHQIPDVTADPAMMRQVWHNLIGNAIKFTAVKEKAIIEIGSEVQQGQNVFFVKDNGAGFDMTYSAKLFDVFQRLHSERDFKGNGVGLAIVKRIVSRFNGKVWGEGTPGTGATFYFSLPMIR